MGLVGSLFKGQNQHTRGEWGAQLARQRLLRMRNGGEAFVSGRRATDGTLKCAATKANSKATAKKPEGRRRGKGNCWDAAVMLEPQGVAGAWLRRLRRYISGLRRC
jgi:hypothetical protein